MMVKHVKLSNRWSLYIDARKGYLIYIIPAIALYIQSKHDRKVIFSKYISVGFEFLKYTIMFSISKQ